MGQEESGRALGARFTLESRLGRGAMGEVWMGTETRTGRRVAAKLLRKEHLDDPGLVARFVNERSIMMGLRHPGIVSVTDLVVDGEDLAIVMEYVEGGSLRDVLRAEGTLAPGVAAGLMVLVLDALEHAHTHQVLHRDVKPDNVLLVPGWERVQEGDARLSDFGVARILDTRERTSSGVVGTPAYMAPELIERGESVPAGDVYGAGIVLYELLCGRTPFAGDGTDYTVALRQLTDAPTALAVPEPLWTVLEAMLAKDPSTRPGAGEAARLLRGLEPELAGLEPLPREETPEAAAPTHVPTVARPATPGRTTSAEAGDPATGTEEAPVTIPGRLRRRWEALVRGTRRRRSDSHQEQQEQAAEERPALPDLGAPDGATVVRPLNRPPAQPERPDGTASGNPSWITRARTTLTRRQMVLIAVGLVLVLAGGVVLGQRLLSGRETVAQPTASADPLPTQAVTATHRSSTTPTGLTVQRDARFDPETGAVHLTLTYSAQAAALTGPFLEVLPGLDGTDTCPTVTWPGGHQSRNLPATTGITTACAWSVDVGAVPTQSLVSVDVVLDLPLPQDGAQGALDQWLRDAAGATDSALADAKVQSTAYPVQRLVDIQVVVPSQVVVQSPLTVTLVPVWPSGADQIDPLYVSPSVGEASTLLRDVAGGADGVSFADGCAGALVVSEDGRSVATVGASAQCVLRAQVGNFTSLTSNSFSVVGHGG